ncbi:MAG: glycosyltransferase family 2 protein, partial [Gammaproteobacteria bacterium]|nr:glycosyltransferase family 2 protein [Gammaproteobacteria bacterium]
MLDSSEDLVSVVIPAYNAAAFIERAVDSVLTQSYRSREVLVVNDGSTDRTGEVLARYGSAIRVIDQPNGGLSSARNRGIREARGEFVALLDADDRWLPEKLERQVQAMVADPGIGFCSTRALVETPEGVPAGEWGCPKIEGSVLRTL